MSVHSYVKQTSAACIIPRRQPPTRISSFKASALNKYDKPNNNKKKLLHSCRTKIPQILVEDKNSHVKDRTEKRENV